MYHESTPAIEKGKTREKMGNIRSRVKSRFVDLPETSKKQIFL
jgi:hypothetical protein